MSSPRSSSRWRGAPLPSTPESETALPARPTELLITDPHLEAPDAFYEALIHAHHELGIEQSHALNARLVLILANHVGSQVVLQQALHLARAGAAPSASGEPA